MVNEKEADGDKLNVIGQVEAQPIGGYVTDILVVPHFLVTSDESQCNQPQVC
jgi:hypothetical protein